jgi:fatty-acyl-CoA synthase
VTLSLARRAERFPDRTALVDISEERLYAPAETVHENRLSYGALSRIAGTVAGALRERGVGAGDTVCLVTRNRVVSLALLFACRRLRATLAPISHRLTPTTVGRPFEVLNPSLVVAEAAQRDLVRSIPFDRTVTIEELLDTASPSVDSAARRPGSEPPLLVLHGEAGQLVAALTASTVEWNCIDAIVAWGLSRDDSGLVLDPLSSPDGLFRTALPLLYVGGRLLFDRAFDPGDALAAIEHHDVTTLSGRTVPLRALTAEANADELSGLERAVCDHAVDDAALETLLAAGVSVTRAYGRLECPTAMSRPVSETTRADDVGTPLLDCQVRLVDADGATLEGEATGTLHLSGPVVADGYAGSDAAPTVDCEPGNFFDGWFGTGERFSRTEDGGYRRQT